MSTGPEPPFILPRQANETAYQYRYRRSVSLYGQTPYQRRIFLAQQRGIGLTAARGHAPRGGQTESQRRRARVLQQTGVTPSQLAFAYATNWLMTHGFTPETTGASWTYLRQMEPSLRALYDRSAAPITPEILAEAIELEREGELPPGWAMTRLRDRVYDTQAYQDYQDKDPGNFDWQTIRLYQPVDTAIEWWYYH